MSEVRLIDANALKYKNLAEVNGRLTHVLTAEEIDNAPTIDFEKLGESLRCQIRAEYGSCDDCELSCPRNELIRLLDLERSQSKWISVTGRLPDKEEYIQCNGLFIVSDGNRVYAEHFDIYDKKCFGEPTIYGFKADRLVIAWQPLPKPYKKGEEE